LIMSCGFRQLAELINYKRFPLLMTKVIFEIALAVFDWSIVGTMCGGLLIRIK
jgi:hypothetical protein